MPWLADEITKIALGQSDISFGTRDKRFADEAWRTIPTSAPRPVLPLFELWMDRMYSHTDGSWQNKARARFAPTSSRRRWLRPTTSARPEALRQAIETGGLSLGRGARNMLRDLARGGCPR